MSLVGFIGLRPELESEAEIIMQDSDESSTDAEIIKRVLRGERDEFRHLIDRHKDMVFGMIMRQVGDRSTAEDIAQETFCRAYQFLKRFRFESSFSTWVTRIALNQTSTYFSSRKFKESRKTESFDSTTHDMAGEDPHKIQETKEALKAFREGLSKLTPKLRDVLILCAFEQKEYDEVASILGIPVGTVRSRLNAARLQIRKFLPPRISEA